MPTCPHAGTSVSTRTSGLVVALGVGFALATSQGTAWADTGGGDTSSTSPHQSDSAATPGGSPSSDGAATTAGESKAKTKSDDADAGSTATASTKTGLGQGTASTLPTSMPLVPLVPLEASHKKASAATEPDSSPTSTSDSSKTSSLTAVVDTPKLAPTSAAKLTTGLGSVAPLVADTVPAMAVVHPSATTFSPKAAATVAVPALTPTPAPVSPIATLLALPARIAYVVLGLIGVTPAAGTTPPISPAPLAQLMWAAFREFENFMGLDAPLVNQPVLPTETFTGSLTTATPTVAQLLDAATAEYVLGGTPAGLVPFTVNGFPVTYTNDVSGAAAQVWVTPQNQIIIAYSGTTGGTNLLFNPLIAITQILADYQAGFTTTTPQAFTDSLQFAHQVQAEAVAQGYAPDSVFVTGHSLGGWEAEYVSQNTGLPGIGFESPGLYTTVPGNGADSLFVNVETYGDTAAYVSSDIPGMQPFANPFVPGGGSNPHYGSIVFIGDPSSQVPLTNAAALWGTSLFGDLTFAITALGQFFQYHLPGVQAYSLDVDPDPVLLPGTGTYAGPVYTGFGAMTIPEFLDAASTAGILFEP